MFRLQIDVPLTDNEEQSKEISDVILKALKEMGMTVANEQMVWTQYRMFKDTDRQPRNYLNKDGEGHARTNKLPLFE